MDDADIEEVPARPVQRVAVVGAGTMGSGIAQVLATAGFATAVHDLSPEALEVARTRIVDGRYGLARGVERGKLTATESAEALARLSFCISLDDAVADADLVVETVYEDVTVKVDTFAALDRLTKPSAVLCSNTSGFPIAVLAAVVADRSRVVGWHWASPPVVQRLAEIVVTPQSDPAAVAAVQATAAACGKNPIVVKDSPMHWGFVANRVFMAALAEAERIVAEGIATPDQVDDLVKDCFGWPHGPLGMVGRTTNGWE